MRIVAKRNRSSYTKNPVVRLLRTVEFDESGCWAWKGTIDHDGYGRVYHLGKKVRAHRLSYELLVGELTPGLVVDHVCRNKACINPDHLELVSQSENVKRSLPTSKNGMTRGKYKKRPTCYRGHFKEWDHQADGYKPCRECQKIRNKERRAVAASSRT